MSQTANLDQLQEELSSHYELLAQYDELLTLAPDDAEVLSERANAQSEIATLEKRIAAAKQPSSQADATPPPPKWDPTKHPKFRKASPEAPPPPPPADDTPTVFNAKDLVLAKWSGDKQFYEATIITKTGSSADPVYTVSFKIDNSTETKRRHEVRAMPGKKRKADAAAAAPAAPSIPPPPAPAEPGTIYAPPVIDRAAAQRKEPSMVSDGPTRMQPEKKKLKGGKVMENKKANWQSFMQNGPKKASAASGLSKPKQSMFRTPDAPNAKVGVVGSGAPMQKDQGRAKWGGGGANGRWEGAEED